MVRLQQLSLLVALAAVPVSWASGCAPAPAPTLESIQARCGTQCERLNTTCGQMGDCPTACANQAAALGGCLRELDAYLRCREGTPDSAICPTTMTSACAMQWDAAVACAMMPGPDAGAVVDAGS